MAKPQIFLLVGCDDNGIHTEAVILESSLVNACIACAHQGIGPIEFTTVAQELMNAGDINNGDLAILETAKDTGKIDVGEINRYKELVDMVDAKIADLASLVFNFGQFAEGADYVGREHHNYVDGDSHSQWKIYQMIPGAAPEDAVKVHPTEAPEQVLIRKEIKNDG